MKIAICDDEQMYIEYISNVIENVAKIYNKSCTIEKCQTGDELIELVKKTEIRAIFLDITMPGTDGYKTAKLLREINEDFIIVFVSANEGMVYMSYEYTPFWFIPKSQLSMLEKVAYKVFEKIRNQENKIDHMEIKVERKKNVDIDFEDAVYFKTEDHYVRMYRKDKSVSELYRNKLNNIEAQLHNQWFVRTHNRYLVNCRLISTIDKNDCVMVNGEKIPISRAYMKNTKDCFQNYMRSIR